MPRTKKQQQILDTLEALARDITWVTGELARLRTRRGQVVARGQRAGLEMTEMANALGIRRETLYSAMRKEKS